MYNWFRNVSRGGLVLSICCFLTYGVILSRWRSFYIIIFISASASYLKFGFSLLPSFCLKYFQTRFDSRGTIVWEGQSPTNFILRFPVTKWVKVPDCYSSRCHPIFFSFSAMNVKPPYGAVRNRGSFPSVRFIGTSVLSSIWLWQITGSGGCAVINLSLSTTDGRRNGTYDCYLIEELTNSFKLLVNIHLHYSQSLPFSKAGYWTYWPGH
jgi:hypothetical protein